MDPLEPDHVRYVGVTMDIDRRRATYAAGHWSGRRVQAWAHRLADAGRRPVLKVLDVGDPCREAEWISDLRARGCELLNTAPGVSRPRDSTRWQAKAVTLDPNLWLLVREAANDGVPRTEDEVIAEALRAHLVRKDLRGPREASWGPLDAWLEANGQAPPMGPHRLLMAYVQRDVEAMERQRDAAQAEVRAAQEEARGLQEALRRELAAEHLEDLLHGGDAAAAAQCPACGPSTGSQGGPP